ncbi:methionine aminopeptidase [Williamsoniiplasma luminosum]|uniref:Methionine aminopeptidase n=1 Tax=Williamsoniiplasma luminosum TaxID=214888 RepID=A0A2K8NT53_9MOLU|nr:type I methionyl aminopeptidase [Williamsoniiplasma luminosum]ATZ17025.1 methionine aminopeptidase [Williamsoniiplasma luminosum]AVP49689.1 MAG: type I methionyl aminopeptidase [Williamsoniiplasma luminosum]
MVTIKNTSEIAKMRIAGQVLAQAIEMLKSMLKPGVNCLDLDQAFADFIKAKDCTSNFLGYYGYPKNICISINDQLIHGIPQDRIIESGDIVSVDSGCVYQGYHADSAFTMQVGTPKAQKNAILIWATEKSLDLVIQMLKPGVRIGDIGSTIQTYIEGFGFHLPRDYTGHGIGTAMHEDPYIPNYGTPGTGLRLQQGMVIAVEPMVQIGTNKTIVADDKWTVFSADHSMTAHFEHTILITSDGCEVLTKLER